jgi:hypothetical protein
MDDLLLLDRALCLPAPDIAALLEGQNIVAISKVAVQRGWTFALYPCDLLIDSLPVEQQYHSYAHTSTQVALASLNASTARIEAWARCELSTMVHDVEQLEALSCSTVWTKAALQETLTQRQHIFLSYLQVFRLAETTSVSANLAASDKRGKFVSLSSFTSKNSPLTAIKVTELLPVLDEAVFIQRKQQLEEGEKPLYFELSKLAGAVSPLTETNIAAKEINQEVRNILGWSIDGKYTERSTPNLDWIKTIASIGNSSNGDLFEKLVRKSFIKLGFENSNSNPKASLDPEGCGGAGGLDFYCEKPYKVVGECKATKTETVPTDTPAQLIRLGNRHLQTGYDECIKIIMAAGELNSHARQTTIGNKMNVIRPETLQRLVEVKEKYAGSIDLLVLEPCLREAPFGEEADTKVNHYIDKVLHEIKLRSQLVHIAKQLTQADRRQFEATEICNAYNFTTIGFGNKGAWLDNQTVYELLIELSSPLAGYLGRLRAGSLSSDRFYYLRDLPVE